MEKLAMSASVVLLASCAVPPPPLTLDTIGRLVRSLVLRDRRAAAA
jgi:hypothetical protein